MVGSINAPTTGNKTLAAFEALAKVANTSSTPPHVAGGTLNIASNSTSGSGSSSAVTSEVTTTVVKTVTAQNSTYTTTYGTTYASTFNSAAAGTSGS